MEAQLGISNYYIQDSTDYSDEELLAMVIGDDYSKETAVEILEYFNGLKGLSRTSPLQLKNYHRMTHNIAMRIYAGMQIGRRSMHKCIDSVLIDTSEKAFEILWPIMANKSEEALYAIFLNQSKNIIHIKHVTQGCETFTILEPRQIFHHALVCRASSFILAHNHPSGDVTPSQQDVLITKRIYNIGEIIGLPLVDHLIISDGSFYSFSKAGMLNPS
jgi:DNA repair protein RadC